jgi:hypothetical protein
MFTQTHVVGDPWIAESSSSKSQYEVSRAAAARHAVIQAVRERRNASRSARRFPRPARVEPVTEPSGAAGVEPARSDQLTSVG